MKRRFFCFDPAIFGLWSKNNSNDCFVVEFMFDVGGNFDESNRELPFYRIIHYFLVDLFENRFES